MAMHNPNFGSPNLNAPAELARFAFLIGKWRCIADILLKDGRRQTYPAIWTGRYILDGFVVADEYCMKNLDGDPIVLGLNLRSYDAEQQRWNIRWLNALSGSWTDLCSDELGGAHFGENTVTYTFREPVAGHAFTRATYTALDPDHFTWLGEKSDDLAAWSEFMLVDCYRVEP